MTKDRLEMIHEVRRTGEFIYPRITQQCAPKSVFIHELPSIEHREAHILTNNPVRRTVKRIYPQITQYCEQESAFTREYPVFRTWNAFMHELSSGAQVCSFTHESSIVAHMKARLPTCYPVLPTD